MLNYVPILSGVDSTWVYTCMTLEARKLFRFCFPFVSYKSSQGHDHCSHANPQSPALTDSPEYAFKVDWKICPIYNRTTMHLRCRSREKISV